MRCGELGEAEPVVELAEGREARVGGDGLGVEAERGRDVSREGECDPPEAAASVAGVFAGGRIASDANTLLSCFSRKRTGRLPKMQRPHHAGTASPAQADEPARDAARASARRARAASSFRSRSRKISRSRPRSLLCGVTYPMALCNRTSL